METLQVVLIVLLSIGLGIMLIAGIIIAFLLIKIAKNVRRVTQRLDETSENLGEMTKYLGRKIGPAAGSAIASVLMRSVKSKFNKRK